MLVPCSNARHGVCATLCCDCAETFRPGRWRQPHRPSFHLDRVVTTRNKADKVQVLPQASADCSALVAGSSSPLLSLPVFTTREWDLARA